MAKRWAEMSHAERLAHSRKWDTSWHKQFDEPAGQQKQQGMLSLGGLPTAPTAAPRASYIPPQPTAAPKPAAAPQLQSMDDIAQLAGTLKPLEQNPIVQNMIGEDIRATGTSSGQKVYMSSPVAQPKYNYAQVQDTAQQIRDSGQQLVKGTKYYDTGNPKLNEALYGRDISRNLKGDGTTGFRTPRNLDVNYFAEGLAALPALAAGVATGGALSGALGGGVLGGAIGGVGNSAVTQGLMTGSIDTGDLLKAGVQGGVVGGGTDLLSDVLTPGVVDPATGATSRTSDIGKLFGPNGLLGGEEINVGALQDAATATGDFFFGQAPGTEWAVLADGTRLSPDTAGNITLPSGQQLHMSQAIADPAIETFRAGESGGLLGALGLNKAADFLADTTLTPIADALVGDKPNPQYDERFYDFESPRSSDLNWDNVLYESPGGNGNTFLEALQAIELGEEEAPEENPRVLTTGGAPVQVDDSLPQDEEEILLPEVPNEQVLAEMSEDELLGGMDGDGELPDVGEEQLYIPEGNDEVAASEQLPQSGAAAAVPYAAQFTTLGDIDEELFRLARIPKVVRLDVEGAEALQAAMAALQARRTQVAEGDVTAAVDPKSGDVITREETEETNRMQA